MPGTLGGTLTTQSIAYEGEGGGAPTNATYLVGSVNGSLSEELVVTGNTWIVGDTSVAGQCKFDIVAGSIGTTQIENLSVSTGKIGNSQVTLAKMANLSGSTVFIGRFTPAAGIPEELSGASATQMLSQFTSTAQGVVAGSGGGTSNFLRADGTWAAPPAGSGNTLYARGSFTVATGNFDIMSRRLTLTSSQRATLQGTGCLRIT